MRLRLAARPRRARPVVASEDGQSWSARWRSCSPAPAQRARPRSSPGWSTSGWPRPAGCWWTSPVARGVISLDGPTRARHEVLRRWLGELTGNPWSNDPRVVIVGNGLPRPEQVEHLAAIEQVLPELEAAAVACSSCRRRRPRRSRTCSGPGSPGRSFRLGRHRARPVGVGEVADHRGDDGWLRSGFLPDVPLHRSRRRCDGPVSEPTATGSRAFLARLASALLLTCFGWRGAARCAVEVGRRYRRTRRSSRPGLAGEPRRCVVAREARVPARQAVDGRPHDPLVERVQRPAVAADRPGSGPRRAPGRDRLGGVVRRRRTGSSCRTTARRGRRTGSAQGDGGNDVMNILGEGRYVRMYSGARSGTAGNSIWEMRVFGEPEPEPASSTPKPSVKA